MRSNRDCGFSAYGQLWVAKRNGTVITVNDSQCAYTVRVRARGDHQPELSPRCFVSDVVAGRLDMMVAVTRGTSGRRFMTEDSLCDSS